MLHNTATQYGDAIAERHRFGLIVCDIDGGGAELALQTGDFGS